MSTERDPYAAMTESEVADFVYARGNGRHAEAQRIADRAAARAAQGKASTAALIGNLDTDETDTDDKED